jgi:hypothetical protein
MNRQVLIKKYKRLEGVWNAPGAETARQIFLQDLKQLDEPEKVVVSEEEAKFLETFNLNHSSDVTKALYYISRVGFGYYLTNNDDLELRGLSEGFRDFENRKRLIRAILDGYEVEKEKRYKVRIKYIENNMKYIVFGKYSESWFLESENESSNIRTNHTRKELEEAGFGEVFNSTLFEVEEVEE